MHTWTSGGVSTKSSRKPSSWSVALALSHSLKGAERRADATACVSSSHSRANMAGCRCRTPKLQPRSSSASLLLWSAATQCRLIALCFNCAHVMEAHAVHVGITCSQALGPSLDMKMPRLHGMLFCGLYSNAGFYKAKQRCWYSAVHL